jgi:hypothetical protein
VRQALGVTQAQLAGLLGVSWPMVSKWERGLARPGHYQAALLERFGRAGKRAGTSAGREVVRMMACGGIAVALYHLLFLSGFHLKVRECPHCDGVGQHSSHLGSWGCVDCDESGFVWRG